MAKVLMGWLKGYEKGICVNSKDGWAFYNACRDSKGVGREMVIFCSCECLKISKMPPCQSGFAVVAAVHSLSSYPCLCGFKWFFLFLGCTVLHELGLNCCPKGVVGSLIHPHSMFLSWLKSSGQKTLRMLWVC